jgi:N-methylhydantoinase A
VRILKSADMRYVGQSYELEVSVAGEIDTDTPAQMVREFHATHERVYGHSARDNSVEFVNLRTVHSYVLPRPTLTPRNVAGKLDEAMKGTRRVVFADYPGGVEAPVYERTLLPTGAQLTGPSIVEQPDSTTVLYPGHRCTVDEIGNLVTAVDGSNKTAQQRVAAVLAGGP